MVVPTRFERTTTIAASAQELGAWHFRPGAVARLIPPWERIEVVREAAPLVDGAIARFVIHKGPLALPLQALHEGVDPPRRFVDRLERGPLASWRHEHTFEPCPGGATLRDAITFEQPLGVLGRALLTGPLRRQLERQFAFRHERTRADLTRHAEIAARFGPRALRIGVTGAQGLVGQQLCAFLSTGGHQVVRFVRGAAKAADQRPWNPTDADAGLDPAQVADLDAIVHLAGAGIADVRWTEARKREIRDSRTLGTAAVARAIARAGGRPPVLVSASAIGFYGDRGDDPVDERSAAGQGFLPEVVQAWEGATRLASEAGARVVHARFGVVLTAAGGALGKMLGPFQLGLGGPVGSGRQGLSWIALDDLLGALLFALRNDALHGPINLVAPTPVPQRAFATTLGRVLRRPSWAPLPAVAVRALLGEMGQQLLLEGAFVQPAVLQAQGFRFERGDLVQALRHELGRWEPPPGAP